MCSIITKGTRTLGAFISGEMASSESNFLLAVNEKVSGVDRCVSQFCGPLSGMKHGRTAGDASFTFSVFVSTSCFAPVSLSVSPLTNFALCIYILFIKWICTQHYKIQCLSVCPSVCHTQPIEGTPGAVSLGVCFVDTCIGIFHVSL